MASKKAKAAPKSTPQPLAVSLKSFGAAEQPEEHTCESCSNVASLLAPSTAVRQPDTLGRSWRHVANPTDDTDASWVCSDECERLYLAGFDL